MADTYHRAPQQALHPGTFCHLCLHVSPTPSLTHPVPTGAAQLTCGVVPHTVEIFGARTSHQLSHCAPGPARANQVYGGVALGPWWGEGLKVSGGLQATEEHLQAIEGSGFAQGAGALVPVEPMGCCKLSSEGSFKADAKCCLC